RIRVTPESSFRESDGRAFELDVELDADVTVRVSAATLLEYQEFQAAVAHQSGRLYRNRAVEAVDDPLQRHLAWMAALRQCVRRPAAGEAMAEAWPWRGAQPTPEQRRCSKPFPGAESSRDWSARERGCTRWLS